MDETPGLKNEFKRHIMMFLSVFICLMPVDAFSYIMPAEQVADLMAANFSRIKTLIITQSTHLVDLENEEVETVIEERIWLKLPWFYRVDRIKGPENRKVETGDPGPVGDIRAERGNVDMTYRRLLMAGDGKGILKRLTEMGININKVAFVRYNGSIAYRLGDSDDTSPELIVEKERFLPLFIRYLPPGDREQEVVSVRFEDYRKLKKGWYPFKIEFYCRDEIKERYLIINLKINKQIKSSFFEGRTYVPSATEPKKNKPDITDERRLGEVIRLLEEKYGKGTEKNP